MSLTGDRQAIADALSLVDGVQGYAYRPGTPNDGDSWPLLSGLERGDGFAFIVTWRVLTYLPQDEQAASDWIDEHVQDLVEVLEPQGFVDSIAPVNLGSDNAPQFGLQVLIRSE